MEQLKSRAKHRPIGYIEDILAKGKQVGDVIELDNSVWRELRTKYTQFSMPLAPNSSIHTKRLAMCRLCPALTNNTCQITEKAICSGLPCPIDRW